MSKYFTSMPERSLWLVLLALSTGIFLWLACDVRFYWHDVRYLYAVTEYSISDLLAGQWNPQYGESLDPRTSGAFYLAKIAFLVPLDWFVRLMPVSDGGLSVLVAVSIFLCLVSASIFAILMRGLYPTEQSSTWIIAMVLLIVSPTLPWLAGKIIAEILALPVILVSLLAGYEWLKDPNRRLFLLACLLTYCIAILARVNISAVVICFFLSYAVTAKDFQIRRLCWRVTLGLIALQALILAFAFASSGIGWLGLVGYVESAIGKGRGVIASLLGGLSSFGLLLPLAIIALFVRHNVRYKFISVWFLTTSATTLAVVSLYQVEARYLIGPLIPLSALAALGFSAVARWLRIKLSAITSIALVWIVVVVGNGFASTLLPYEIDYRDMERAVEASENDDAVLLVSWAYSDFNFIRIVWPDVDAYSVHVPRDSDGNLVDYSAEWQEILRDWYGDRFLLNIEDLVTVIEDRDVYYLGWGVHPPIQNWADNAARFGLSNVADMLTELGGQSHWNQSWVVSSNDLEVTEFRQFGQYSLSKVELK